MKDSLKGAVTGAALIQDIYVFDTSSSTNAGLAGLVYNTSGLLAYYKRKGFAPVAFTLAAATLGTWTGTATAGGIVPTTNLSGGYELHLPTNALAAGVPSVEYWIQGAANMNPCVGEIKLVAFDDQDAVRMGLTALPNAAAGANGGLPLGDASGRVDLGKWLGTAPAVLTASGYIQSTLRRWLTDDAAGTPAALSATGKFIQAMLTRWKTDDTAGTPSDLDTNRVQTKVAAVATDAIDAAALKADGVTKIQAGLATVAAQVTAQTTLGNIVTAQETAQTALDELTNALGNYTFTKPTTFPGTGTLAFEDGPTHTLTYDAAGVIISRVVS